MKDIKLLELEKYAERMFNRNLKIFSQNIFTPLDFVHEAVLIGYDTIEEAKKTIVSRIINEKRRLIARIQQSEQRSQFDVREKKCCKCKFPKPIQEFAPRIDTHTGLQYYNSYCRDCERERRRLSYANSVQQKISNRERQRRYRMRYKNAA
jgi:hypothetical protein